MKTKYDIFIKSSKVRELSPSFKLTRFLLGAGQWIFPNAVANFVRERFFIPKCKPLSNEHQGWISRAESFKVPFKDTSISAWKIGSGPPILFVHGWNGRGVQFYPFFQSCFDAGYSVVFYDATGHGASGGKLTHYLDMTNCFSEIYNYNFGEEITGIIGHSMGAGVAINYLTDHPADVPLVFISPALKLFELLFHSFQYHGIPKRTYVNLILDLEAQYQISLDTRNPIDLIRYLDNDILIIHDESDKITPIAPSISASEKLVNVELMKTRGLGHNHILKDPGVINSSICFLQDQGLRSQKPESINKTAISRDKL